MIPLVVTKARALNTLYHAVYDLSYHLVLVTKYRRRCFTPEMLETARNIFAATLEKWEGELIEFNGEADHVHLLLSSNPKTAPSNLVNNLKTVCSRLLRRDYRDHLERVYRQPVLWSRSYCILTTGGASIETVRAYIENQAGA